MRTANELAKQGIVISQGGVRGVWLRHGLETKGLRLKKLEKWAADNLGLLTESQVHARAVLHPKQGIALLATPLPLHVLTSVSNKKSRANLMSAPTFSFPNGERRWREKGRKFQGRLKEKRERVEEILREVMR